MVGRAQSPYPMSEPDIRIQSFQAIADEADPGYGIGIKIPVAGRLIAPVQVGPGGNWELRKHRSKSEIIHSQSDLGSHIHEA